MEVPGGVSGRKLFYKTKLFLFLASFISKLNGNVTNCVAKLFASKRPHQATGFLFSILLAVLYDTDTVLQPQPISGQTGLAT